MKGLQEKTNDGIFLHIKHGTICEESKTPKEKFVPVEVTNPRSGQVSTKYIKPYKLVEAMIKRIEWYEREYDGTPFMGWKLVLDADGVICTLDLPLQSQTATRFMKLAENLDFSVPVEFSAWKTADDKTALSVKQNGVQVPQKYTKDNPGDCPPPVQGFGKKWNYDAQTQFLHERMTHVVIPRLVALHGAEREQAESQNGTGAQSADTPAHTADGAEITDPMEAIRRSVKALAGTKVVDNATEEKILKDYFGTDKWNEVEMLPVGLLKAQAVKLDDLIPF
jgi:hypothetical protein